MAHPDATQFEDEVEEALRGTLEQAKQAYAVAGMTDLPKAKAAFRAALDAFSTYTIAHSSLDPLNDREEHLRPRHL